MGSKSDLESARHEHPRIPQSSSHGQSQSVRQRGYASFHSLLPFTSWVQQYDATSLASDLVAGLTIGAVVIPQGMAYALLARLDPVYGLYSSFIGGMVYWMFGTSKDISVGPVAVLSTVVGNVVHKVNSHREEELSPHIIASALSIMAGLFVLLMGLLRVGWVIEYIPVTSLSAFVTGSAITIISSQLPSLLGLDGFSNREATYKLLGNVLQSLGSVNGNGNAKIGLSALATLYFTRYVLSRAASMWPTYKQVLALLCTMRTVLVIVVFTAISWLINSPHSDQPSFAILGSIPKGLPSFSTPTVDLDLYSKISTLMPAAVIVMLAEHIAIAKSFGRESNYIVNPSQEMVALGVINLISPLFGGYPSTGSFSRTAIQSRAGARTPAAGIFTGLLVLVSTYFMTSTFFYIPSAVLAAVVIHAVGDLIVAPATIRRYWLISPAEVGIFTVGVALGIVTGIEQGLYVTVSLSMLLLLCKKIAIAEPRFFDTSAQFEVMVERKTRSFDPQKYGTFEQPNDLSETSSENEDPISLSPDGVVTCVLPENLSFASTPAALERLTSFALATFRPETQAPNSMTSTQDRMGYVSHRLTAIVLDFGRVKFVDVTAVQRLEDVKKRLNSALHMQSFSWRVAGVMTNKIGRALDASSL